jgi:hypothetical protein
MHRSRAFTRFIAEVNPRHLLPADETRLPAAIHALVATVPSVFAPGFLCQPFFILHSAFYIRPSVALLAFCWSFVVALLAH